MGCAKNLVDSEVMLGTLRRAGMELTEDSRQADVVIVNTCGFIEAAKQESIDTILKANELRATGNCKALIMAGCLAQRYPKDLAKDWHTMRFGTASEKARSANASRSGSPDAKPW